MIQEPASVPIINGLKNREDKAYRILYQFYYPMVERFVLRNSGHQADAQDVFQETVLILLAKIQREDFSLTSTLKTYIFAISSNLWLKRLRESRRVHWQEVSENDTLTNDCLVEQIQVEAEQSKQTLVGRWLSKITKPCALLLKKLFFAETDPETVRAEMGYKNHHTLHNLKYKCMLQLKKVAEK